MSECIRMWEIVAIGNEWMFCFGAVKRIVIFGLSRRVGRDAAKCGINTKMLGKAGGCL